MNVKDVTWLSPYKLGDYQFFRQWATEAWEQSGGLVHKELWLPWKLKMLIGKSGLVRRLPLIHPPRRLIVTVCGRPDYFCWPQCYGNEIVPIVWDCWPKYWEALVRFVRRNKTKTIFCTSSQTADMIRSRCPGCRAVWLPEGIKVDAYPMGGMLRDRPVDLLEIGRTMPKVAESIAAAKLAINYRRPSQGELLFPDFAALTAGLRSAKLVVCYPRCDTNPEHAGKVETLTQRYWECMLSGCLMVGRAPKELVDFCGYNPVIELGDSPAEKVTDVLARIGEFQDLVNRNRAFAERHADWSERIKKIREVLDA